MKFEHLNEYSGDPKKKAKRLCEGKALLSPSHYEANPYLVMEALACGVPIISYAVGAMVEMDERVGYVTDDLSVANFMRFMRKVNAGDVEFAPREYAEEHFPFSEFKKQWREYLDH